MKPPPKLSVVRGWMNPVMKENWTILKVCGVHFLLNVGTANRVGILLEIVEFNVKDILGLLLGHFHT